MSEETARTHIKRHKELITLLKELIEKDEIQLAIPKKTKIEWLVEQIEEIAKYNQNKFWKFGFLKAGEIRNRLERIMEEK